MLLHIRIRLILTRRAYFQYTGFRFSGHRMEGLFLFLGKFPAEFLVPNDIYTIVFFCWMVSSVLWSIFTWPQRGPNKRNPVYKWSRVVHSQIRGWCPFGQHFISLIWAINTTLFVDEYPSFCPSFAQSMRQERHMYLTQWISDAAVVNISLTVAHIRAVSSLHVVLKWNLG